MTDENRTMTIPETARLLHIDEKYLREMIRQGKFDFAYYHECQSGKGKYIISRKGFNEKF